MPLDIDIGVGKIHIRTLSSGSLSISQPLITTAILGRLEILLDPRIIITQQNTLHSGTHTELSPLNHGVKGMNVVVGGCYNCVICVSLDPTSRGTDRFLCLCLCQTGLYASYPHRQAQAQGVGVLQPLLHITTINQIVRSEEAVTPDVVTQNRDGFIQRREEITIDVLLTVVVHHQFSVTIFGVDDRTPIVSMAMIGLDSPDLGDSILQFKVIRGRSLLHKLDVTCSIVVEVVPGTSGPVTDLYILIGIEVLCRRSVVLGIEIREEVFTDLIATATDQTLHTVPLGISKCLPELTHLQLLGNKLVAGGIQ